MLFMVVLCESSSEAFEDVAKKIAADRGEELVREPVPTDEPVVYVTDPLEADEDTVHYLLTRLAENGPTSGSFSVVTGYTADDAGALYEREPGGGGDHRILLREETHDWFTYDDDATVETGEDVTLDQIDGERAQSLSMLVHGRSMHFFFADGYLCGFPSDAEGLDFDGPQPYCVDGREPDCPLTGELVHADAVQADHLFVDSCASMLPGNDFGGLPVHVGMGLLRNASSAIGGYRQIDSIPNLSLLHYCLLRAGYSLAERCYYLNKAAHSYGTAAYPYVPFGRPEARDSLRESHADYALDDDQVVLENVDAHVVHLSLPEADDADRYYLRTAQEKFEDAPIYYASFEGESGPEALVYTWGNFEAEELRLELATDPVGEVERHYVDDAMENLPRVERLGLLDNKSKGQWKDLQNRLSGFASEAWPQVYDANAHWDVAERVERVTDRLDQIRDRIRTQVESRYSSFLSEDYRDDFIETRATATDDTCPQCDRRLYEKRMTDWVGDARRLRGVCSMCGVVYDVPDLDEAETTYPAVRGSDLIRVESDSCEFMVEFENPRDVPMQASLFPWLGIDNDEYRNADVFTPESVETVLDSGQRMRESFTIDVSGLEDNEYWICAYLLGNLDVYQGLTKLVVGEDLGHLRADLRE